MASLENQPIDGTYQGLLKTANNEAIGLQTASVITDGEGNPTPLKLAELVTQIEVPVAAGGINGITVNDTVVRLKSGVGSTVFMTNNTDSFQVAVQDGGAFIGGSTSGHFIVAGPNEVAYTGNQDFTAATVTGINSGVTSIIAGSGITVDTSTGDVTVTATGGGGGGTENNLGLTWDANVVGYPSNTYAYTAVPIVGTPFYQVDNNFQNLGVLNQLFVEPGVAITSFINAFFEVTADDTHELAIYDTYSDGSPKDKVFTTTVNILLANGASQYVETAVSFTPAASSFWIGLLQLTAPGVNSKRGMVSPDRFVQSYVNFGAYGPTPVGVLQVNSLTAQSFPANFAQNEEYGHIDPVYLTMYKK